MQQFLEMDLNFVLGGGIYTLKGVKIEGRVFDITLLFDGSGGSPTIRDKIG